MIIVLQGIQVVLKHDKEEMGNGSAIEALRKIISQIEELLGEQPNKDDIVALWVEHIVGKMQIQRNILETHMSPNIFTYI